ncbi:SIS domain-containing protein [Acidomonas methanolica]|uniref:SIS domain-containing protein n=1 Tax=Acidomonas methanolica TaxID=437 RepID=UPI00211A02B1|nr:SIS domain-containing protein [Acidomonas methanolica]MCQ9156427.1 SIS domain-containing protein [Acidomonas methanolica]
MTRQHGTFLDQIAMLPRALRDFVWPIEERARKAIDTPSAYRVRQIILIGSGDSHCAALAAVPAARAWTGLPVFAMPAMEAARYLDLGRTDSAHGTLAVIVSASGAGARIIEAARRLTAAGALTLAVTSAPDSPLAEAASRTMCLPPVAPGMMPGTTSCMISLLGLMLLAIRIAEVRLRMSMDDAGRQRQAIADLADVMEAAWSDCAAAARRFAARVHAAQRVDCLGSGPAFGSAAFLAAKLTEGVGLHAVTQDTEEFCHLNFFCAEPQLLPTILFGTGTGARATRDAEVADAIVAQQRPFLLITDHAGPRDEALVLPPVDEGLAPLLHLLPASLVAAFWAEAAGSVPFRGHSGPWAAARDAALVRRSTVLIREAQS